MDDSRNCCAYITAPTRRQRTHVSSDGIVRPGRCAYLIPDSCRSIAVASSCCPCSSASCRASVAHLIARALSPVRAYAVASAKKIPRRLGVSWKRQLLELGDRLLRFPKPDQHAAQVEAGEPEVGPARRGVPVLFGGGAGEPLTLQDLAEVVVRVGVLRVDCDGQAVRFGRAIPLGLHPEQHAVIVVGIAEVDAERDDRAIVGLRPAPVLDLTVERDQVRVRLRERRVAGDCGFVGRDRARQIAGARELEPSREIRRGVISEGADAGQYFVFESGPRRSRTLRAARARAAHRRGGPTRGTRARGRSRQPPIRSTEPGHAAGG